MEKANMILRFLSVTQVSIVISTLIVNTVIDIFLFKNAKEVGGIQWGKIPHRAQYALLLLCVVIVTLMGLMGFIRSGLRMNWHVYGFMQDKSDGAFTPSIAYMGWVVGLIVFCLYGLGGLFNCFPLSVSCCHCILAWKSLWQEREACLRCRCSRVIYNISAVVLRK